MVRDERGRLTRIDNATVEQEVNGEMQIVFYNGFRTEAVPLENVRQNVR